MKQRFAPRSKTATKGSRVWRCSACQDGCPRSVLAFVASLATNAHVSQGLADSCGHAACRFRDRYALGGDAPLVHGGTTSFGRPKLAPRTPVVLAVLRALSDAWSTDPEANRMLMLARNSSDPELRHAAEVVRRMNDPSTSCIRSHRRCRCCRSIRRAIRHGSARSILPTRRWMGSPTQTTRRRRSPSSRARWCTGVSRSVTSRTGTSGTAWLPRASNGSRSNGS